MTLAELNRLRDADTLLAGDGLHVTSFTREQGVSQKTVFRVLAFLKAAGYPSHVVKRGGGRHPDYRHFYAKGVKRMFAKRK